MLNVHRSRGWFAPAALLLLGLTASGCGGGRLKVDTVEESPVFASVIKMGDPRQAKQLVTGFFEPVVNTWRWTAKQFVVLLKVPAGAAQTGGVLKFELGIPKSEMTLLKKITLSASINGLDLPPETFVKDGSFVYTRDVPATALTNDPARVTFSLDRGIPPNTGGDPRELGIIATSISLQAK